MKINKLKILFIVPHLKAGGAERVISFIFNEINKNIFDPYLIVIGHEKSNVYNVLGSNVIYLNKKRLRNSVLKIAILILNIRPEIVFSSIGHINLYLGFLKYIFPKTKFISREANIYSIRKSFVKTKSLPHFILNFLYSSLDIIIFQTLEMKNDFINNFKISPNKTYVINNPITFTKPTPPNYVRELLTPYKFIVVGRLEKAKGHSRILNIFKSVDFDFTINILGEGPLRRTLESEVKQFNLSSKVNFHGSQKNIANYYSNTDFLIQGSFVEGFPNAVLEALSFGIPCLIFEAPGGHNELIIEGFNGMIIKDSDNLTEVINNFISFSWDRKLICDDVYKRFNPSEILDQYENVFKKS